MLVSELGSGTVLCTAPSASRGSAVRVRVGTPGTPPSAAGAPGARSGGGIDKHKAGFGGVRSVKGL